MKNKILISIILSIIFSSLLVFAAVYASTTIGTNISTDGTLTVSGNVGIGTTTPYSKFQVTSGAGATTTVNFGEVGAATSRACFNTKNTAGADISFYFNASNEMVIESNPCR